MASSVKASFIILFLTIVLKGNDVMLPGIAGKNILFTRSTIAGKNILFMRST